MSETPKPASLPIKPSPPPAARSVAITPPSLVIKWESWPQAFLRNLGDQLRPAPPPLILTSRPATFWHDVFVQRKMPARPFVASFIYHVGFAAFLYLFPIMALLMRPAPLQVPKQDKTLTYYQVSEYLPPIQTPSAPAKVPRKGQPAYARQEIISVPPAPDNYEQTVIDPLLVKVDPEHIQLPNMVVWTEKPVPAAPNVSNLSPKLVFPLAPVEVVQPAAEARARDIAKLKMPDMPQPSVVEPPPTPDAVQRKLGDINMARMDVEVAEPKLPVPEQRAVTNINTASVTRQGPESNAPPPTPALALPGGTGAEPSGKLLALGLHPADVHGPITLPGGNRHGEFAATPEGKPDAPGTPEIKAGGEGNGGSSTGNSGGPGSGPSQGATGIYVGPGPVNPVAAVAGKPSDQPAPDTSQPREVATVVPPPSVYTPREGPGHGLIEDAVFNGKRYYTLTLNMPNLTSAGGSWVIRFAELNEQTHTGELSAPVAIEKVDPKYPSDLVHDRVEGTVTLYAVIHSDGTVGSIRVLRGIDARLDENARVALSQWRFRPATKNGAAVDLEAVIHIPFKARKLPF
jgi:TonB family protein